MKPLVFYDLETGGLVIEPTAMPLADWQALRRKPEPVVRVTVDGKPWVLCPGNPIIQVAAVAVDEEWTELGWFEAKLRFRPELAAPEALQMNSYDPEVWAREAVNYPAGLQAFATWLEKYRCVEMISKAGNPYTVAKLAGFNAGNFDQDMLIRSMRDPLWQGRALPGDNRRGEPRSIFLPAAFAVLDVMHDARWAHHRGQIVIPCGDCSEGSRINCETCRGSGEIDSLKLTDLARAAGHEFDAHDALSDVRATIAVARWLEERKTL